MQTTLTQGFIRSLFFALLLLITSTSQAAEKGLLWKLEAPNGNISYLFGTMHTDDARVNDFSNTLKQAFTQSEVFMMETLPPESTSVYLNAGQNLDELLNEKERLQLLKLADFHAMHTEVAMRMKPWLLAMVFDLPKPESPYAQDVQLLEQAQAQSKQLGGLEETSEHFGALDSFTQQEQLSMLRAVLNRTQQEKQRDYDALLNAYLAGDAEKIMQLDEKITGGMLPQGLWARMRVKLLDERNTRMAQRIAQEAQQSKVFVAVGASHLAGANGLLAQLKTAGYRVSAVQ